MVLLAFSSATAQELDSGMTFGRCDKFNALDLAVGGFGIEETRAEAC